MKKLIVGAMALAAAEAFAIQGTLSTESESLTGDIKWQARSKQYVISVTKGKTAVDMERKLADVVSLDIPKPAGFDKAVQAVESGQGSSAIGTLKKIVDDYHMLQWDKPAGRYLVQAYIAKGDAKSAYDVCEPIIREDKSAAWSGDLAAAYWQALLKLGKREQLDGFLKKAASSGNRQASAAALVMRADIIVADANGAPDKLRQALADGYLRVALMYQDEDCRRERAEACLKAAKCFDTLGQAARAEKLRAQAKAI